MTAVDVEASGVRRDLQSRPIRGIRKEIYHQTRQFCEDFEERHLNPAIDSLLQEFNRQLRIQGIDGEPAPAGVTVYSFFSCLEESDVVIDSNNSIYDLVRFKFSLEP